MNWTSREPIEGVECIVETNTGCVFPAHYIKGTWWNTQKAFPIEGVERWIVYPEGEEPNDLPAPEVLLKWAYKEQKNLKEIAKGESEKVKSLRTLNKQLTEQFNALHTRHMNLQANIQSHNYASDEELERLRQLNKTLLETCKDLKLKAENAKNDEIKRLQKENSRLRGYLKSLGHIFKTVMDMENDYTEQGTNED